jgi:hypothetical protein
VNLFTFEIEYRIYCLQVPSMVSQTRSLVEPWMDIPLTHAAMRAVLRCHRDAAVVADDSTLAIACAIGECALDREPNLSVPVLLGEHVPFVPFGVIFPTIPQL